MPKFRKKNIEVCATQYHDEMRVKGNLPEGVFIVPTDTEGDMPVVHALDGDVIVRDKDYVVKALMGDFFVVHPITFEAAYEIA